MDLYKARKLGSFIAFVSNYSGLLDTYRLVRKHRAGSHMAILSYHRVAQPAESPWSLPAVTPENFEKQISYLRKYHEILPIEVLVRSVQEGKPFPERAVVITFDDGYKDNFTRAYPILRKYNVPATISLTTANIDNREPFWWDKIGFAIWNTPLRSIDLNGLGIYRLRSRTERLQTIYRITRELARKPEKARNYIANTILDVSGIPIPADLGEEILLSWDDVLNMKDNGISFGAHTVTHPNLSESILNEARIEIIESKITLEDKLEQKIKVFCYPNGDFTLQVAEIVEEAGFDCALTLVPRLVDHDADLFQLGRIPGGWNVSTLKLFLAGPFVDLANVPVLDQWIKT